MIEIVTEESLKSKLIWDLLPHNSVADFMTAAGIIPGSPEGQAMEHRASHLRIAAAEPVEQIVALMAVLSGEIVARSILESQGIEYDEEFVGAYESVALHAALAVVMNLLDLNLIHLGGHS